MTNSMIPVISVLSPGPELVRGTQARRADKLTDATRTRHHPRLVCRHRQDRRRRHGGEVYRARDTKLDRDVALKVLPEAFTPDSDRLVYRR